MAMMECSFCRFPVPRGALVCAHCNANFSYEFSWNKFLPIVMVLGFIFLGIAGIAITGFFNDSGFKALMAVVLAIWGAINLASKFSYVASATRDGRTIAIDEE